MINLVGKLHCQNIYFRLITNFIFYLVESCPNMIYCIMLDKYYIMNVTETHCEFVHGCILVDDIEVSVVIGEKGFVIHCPFKRGIGAFKH